MRNLWLSWIGVLSLLVSTLLTSCASAPPPSAPPVVAKCPPWPELPANLQQAPQATSATDDLQTAFQEWVGDASTTPPKSPSSNAGTPSNGPTPPH